MSLRYIRNYFEVPAHRGTRVEFTGGKIPKQGTIRGSEGMNLRILMDGEAFTSIYHPTRNLRYLAATLPSEETT